MKSFYFLLLFLCTFQLIAQNPDSCDGERYLTEIFTDVSAISGIKFGEGTTFGGEFQELFMDVYFPTGDLVEARPTIVLAFGGSFIFGERADLQGLCEAYARRGYVAATIDYRLYDGPLFPLPNEQDMQNVVIRAISDMKAAIRHLREDAATTNLYKIDPNYIFSGGVSAGAIVASHVAAMDETDEISPILQELVDENGGFEGNSSDNYEYSSAVQGCINLSGALNDAKLIDANDPPFISYHDDMDGVVPYAEGFATIFGVPIGYLEGSAAMHYVADSVGVENELYTIENSDGHVSYLTGEESTLEVIDNTSAFIHLQICKGEVSTNDLQLLADVKAYPNPTNGILHLEYDFSSPHSLTLYDVLGRKVANWENEYQIDISDFEKGVYFLHIQNIANQKFAVKKITLE